jgi:hypothetical protein
MLKTLGKTLCKTMGKLGKTFGLCAKLTRFFSGFPAQYTKFSITESWIIHSGFWDFSGLRRAVYPLIHAAYYYYN